MSIIPEKYEALETVTEQEHFVYYYGDMYCIRESCEGCQHLSTCEHTDGEIEVGSLYPELALRRAIGFGKITDADAYKLEINPEEIDDYTYVNGRFTSNLQDSGYLPDQNVKGIYKQLPELPTEEATEYMLYHAGDKIHYCVRQVCKLCEHNEKCNPVLIVRPKEFAMIATDLKAQEPRLFSVLSKEPKWLSVLQNDGLRDDKQLLLYINELFQTHPELMINIDKDQTYWKYLDNRFFFDKTVLYQFNSAVLKHKRLNKDKTKENLIAFIEYIVDDWKDYLKELKAKG